MCDVGSGGALRWASRGVGWAASQSQRCEFGSELAELGQEVCRQEHLSSLEHEIVQDTKVPHLLWWWTTMGSRVKGWWMLRAAGQVLLGGRGQKWSQSWRGRGAKAFSFS